MKSNEWIPVSDRLPEKGALVVVLCRYKSAPIRYYITHEQYDPRSHMWRDGSARYWVQLPEIPEVNA